MTPESAILPHTLVTEVCGRRAHAMRLMDEATALIARGHELARQADEAAAAAHMGAVFSHDDRQEHEAYKRLFETFDADRSRSVYRHATDARIWSRLMDATGMSARMDRTAKDQFRASLQGDVPEVTEENVEATFRALAGDAKLIFQRGLARAFSTLDRRFRSHDVFKLRSRIILTHVFDQFGYWNWHGRQEETLADVERVFQVLDGVDLEPSVVRAIREDRRDVPLPGQSVTETPYFRVRCYANGNAHLWFTRDDLVTKANLVLADYYGEVLPDAYTGNAPDRDVRSKTGALSTDLAFYATPPAVAERLVSTAGAWRGARVLEPSAGTGAVARAALSVGADVDVVEVHPERAAVLRGIRGLGRVVERNFLEWPARRAYTHVLMNPPFAGTHWMEHVLHAFDFLEPLGTLAAVLPATAEIAETSKHEAFRAWADQHEARWHALPAESFASSGTRVSTCILTLRGPR